jgi:hypothetical protein
MSEPQRLPLLKVHSLSQIERPVEYVPPAPGRIDQYVQAVCRELTQKNGTNYCDTDFVRGLTTFMKVVASIQTRYLNRGVSYVQSKG